MEKGVCLRVIGNLSLLPADIQKLIAEAMLLTKDNKNAVLNLAFAYTSKINIFIYFFQGNFSLSFIHYYFILLFQVEMKLPMLYRIWLKV